MDTQRTVLANNGAKRHALVAALRVSAPIMAGYLCLATGYGIYMTGRGFAPWWPVCMAATIYAGSVEFVTVELLLSAFSPLYALLLTFALNGRHIFYGISILDKYRRTGWKRFLLVSLLVDEAFSVNYISDPPAGVPRDWYMLFVSLWLYISWIVGAAIGAFAGSTGMADVKGTEFVMPALFIVIFISQWQKEQNHTSSVVGLLAAVVCLPIFGGQYFLLGTLLVVTLGFTVKWMTGDRRKEERP